MYSNERQLGWFGGGASGGSTNARITVLENNEYKIVYWQSISSDTGTITIPTGATILLDQFESGADAFVSTIVNSEPSGIYPKTSLGATVDVTSFNALGTYALNGVPSAYPVALIFLLKIKAKDYGNLIEANILIPPVAYPPKPSKYSQVLFNKVFS